MMPRKLALRIANAAFCSFMVGIYVRISTLDSDLKSKEHLSNSLIMSCINSACAIPVFGW